MTPPMLYDISLALRAANLYVQQADHPYLAARQLQRLRQDRQKPYTTHHQLI
jgi:hypothetical protein